MLMSYRTTRTRVRAGIDTVVVGLIATSKPSVFEQFSICEVFECIYVSFWYDKQMFNNTVVLPYVVRGIIKDYIE